MPLVVADFCCILIFKSGHIMIREELYSEKRKIKLKDFSSRLMVRGTGELVLRVSLSHADVQTLLILVAEQITINFQETIRRFRCL